MRWVRTLDEDELEAVTRWVRVNYVVKTDMIVTI